MLALDDPRWNELTTDGLPVARILDGLRALYGGAGFSLGGPRSSGGFDFTAGTLHQRSVYSSAFAVVPHVVHVAALATDAAAGAAVWTWLGVIASAQRQGHCSAPGFLDADYQAALARAEACATACFMRLDLAPSAAADLALAAVALAGHGAGRFLWSMPEEPTRPLALFITILCPRCEQETELMSLADGVAALGEGDTPPAEADRAQPLVRAPVVHDAERWGRRDTGAWADIAQQLAVESAAREVIDRGFFDVALEVARRAVPASAPEPAVLSLAATLLALRGHSERARALARLASDVRCPECGAVSPLVAAVPGMP